MSVSEVLDYLQTTNDAVRKWIDVMENSGSSLIVLESDDWNKVQSGAMEGVNVSAVSPAELFRKLGEDRSDMYQNVLKLFFKLKNKENCLILIAIDGTNAIIRAIGYEEV
jgi:hypothetical protein